jgi:hypothetical protein
MSFGSPLTKSNPTVAELAEIDRAGVMLSEASPAFGREESKHPFWPDSLSLLVLFPP